MISAVGSPKGEFWRTKSVWPPLQIQVTGWVGVKERCSGTLCGTQVSPSEEGMAKGQACGRVSLTEYLIACQLIIGAVHLCTHFVFWEYG